MSLRMILRRGMLAVAISALLAGAALAGQTITDTTRIEVRTQTGSIERVSLSDLKVGEIRSFTTESGSAGVAKRTEKGLDLQISGENFAIDMPDPETDAVLAHHGEHELVIRDIDERVIVEKTGPNVVVHKHHGEGLPGDGKRVIVRKLQGDPSQPAALDDLPSLSDPGNEGKRVLVMRTIEKTDDSTAN